MTTPDECVQTAWASPDPMALHRAAERLAADGHPEADITAALDRLLSAARAAGADDAAEDRITDVMERFTDWARASNRIHSPPLPQAGYAVTFPDPATERRGLGYLAAQFAGRVRSNGAHVIPREALTALADQGFTFTVVGPARSD